MTTLDRIRKIVATELRRPLDAVTAESDLFEDLGCDDLDRIAIGMGLEEAFHVEIDDEDLLGVRTIEELAQLADRKVAGP